MNDRTLQDLLEWLVLGLLIAVGLLLALWLGGWVFTFLGKVLLALSGLIWTILKYAVPALVLVGLAYLVARFLQKRPA
ncbi:hypothetical protein [Thermus filiformis]|uniref:Uncharacterized protein n=1 Tax=Thermus filiformis TaxID=276 RepID=A0A0A2WTH7_THEFI|nr:hypothetical protein [Thermus filiformis]KGQ23103.1 hypothetical protein THFILI_07305 [Thermus filiformis]